MVGAGAAHHRLVVVVGHRVVLGEVVEHRARRPGRCCRSPVETRPAGWTRRSNGSAAGRRSSRRRSRANPQPAEVLVVRLLVHLVEAVQRIADVGAVVALRVPAVDLVVRDVPGDLERRVRHVGREPRIDGALLEAAVAAPAGHRWCSAAEASRTVPPASGSGSTVRCRVGRRPLLGQRDVGPGIAVCLHDPLRAQVLDRLASGRLVRGVDVVERMVLAQITITCWIGVVVSVTPACAAWPADAVPDPARHAASTRPTAAAQRCADLKAPPLIAPAHPSGAVEVPSPRHRFTWVKSLRTPCEQAVGQPSAVSGVATSSSERCSASTPSHTSTSPPMIISTAPSR